MVGTYLRHLPEELGAQVRDLAPDAELETLYTAAKFAVAREDRPTTHLLLRDMRGLPLSRGDAAGLLMFSGESDGSADSTFAARGPRAPAAHIADRAVQRHGGGFYGDGTGSPASDRRREGFPDRPVQPSAMSSPVPPRPYALRTWFGFEDAQGRDQGRPMPRNRAAGRRYSADPRPTRWPQVNVMNVQPPPPGALRLMEPDLSPCDIAERLRPAVRSWGQRVDPVICVQADWAPTDELHQVPAGMRSRSTPGQSLPRVQCHGIVFC